MPLLEATRMAPRCASDGPRAENGSSVGDKWALGSRPVAAAAHTGAVAGDQRVFRALVEDAGAAWAEDVHELLELAKAQAVARPRPARRPSGGLAVLTCSGGDSALAADECERLGLDLATLGEATSLRLRKRLPGAATVGNPLDYTALIWGDAETLSDLIATVGEDAAVDQMLVLYDQPAGIEGAVDEAWSAVRDGIHAGAARSPVPTMADTLPEMLDGRGGALRRRRITAISACATGSCARGAAPQRAIRLACARSRPWRPDRPVTPTADRHSPSTKPSSCCAVPAYRWWKDAWP